MDVQLDAGDLQCEVDLWTAALVILLTSSDRPTPLLRKREDKEFIAEWLGSRKQKRGAKQQKHKHKRVRLSATNT